MPTLGEELRQARENKGISLRQISDATHIGLRFLQAIESDNYKILPGGIFNRAFVKSFARYVGIDEEQALALYQVKLDEQGGEPVRNSGSRYEALEETDTSPWSSTLLAALVILIIGLGAYGAWRYFGREKHEEKKVEEPTPTPTRTLPVVAVEPTPAPSASVSASPGALVTPSPSPGASPSPAPPLTGALVLKLQAKGGDCWIKVRTDSDPKGQMATLKSGESREFSANDKLIINVGNVLTLDATLNGRPAKILANKGKVSAEGIIINKENYQQFVQ